MTHKWFKLFSLKLNYKLRKYSMSLMSTLSKNKKIEQHI